MSINKYILSAFLCLVSGAGKGQCSTSSDAHSRRIGHYSSHRDYYRPWADRINEKRFTPLSTETDTSDHYCYDLTQVAHLLWEDGIPSSYKKGYDTLQRFIEECGAKHTIENYGSPGEAFNEIASDVQGMDTANSRWLEFREWLKKVLYINVDTFYYCEDVDAMLTTFNYLIPGKGTDYNGAIAIADYIINNNRCPDLTKELLRRRKETRDYQLQIWRDTVVDSNATPIDTSAVTIDEIGFSILRGQSGVVGIHKVPRGLSALVATKNPFEDQTTLELTIGDAMMLRLEIIDVLGRALYSENRFFSAGDIRWVLEGKDFPEGSFYARISTIGGEVRTIKLVHK